MVNRNAGRLTLSLIVCGVLSHATTPVPGQQPVAQQQTQQQAAQQRYGPQRVAQQPARQPARQQPAQGNPALNQAVVPPASANVPKWMPLAPAHEKHLNDILNFWEHKTAQIERYRCNFKRYEYEMTRRVTPTNQTTWEFVNKTYTEGKIQYETPDKGLFEAEVIKHRTPSTQPGGPPTWRDQEDGPKEHWVCDGESIFEFNHSQKQLIVRPLPPGMKGKQIAEGPLPFMFGAKAEQIKSRFWVHVITPEAAQKNNEFHLEAVPKTLQDAQNFRMLHIIIDGGDFLPKAMVLFHRNNAKTTFLFEQREVNWNTTLADITFFRRKFFEPKLPDRDWKKVIVPVEQSATGSPEQPPRNAAVRLPFGPARQAQAPRGRQAPR